MKNVVKRISGIRNSFFQRSWWKWFFGFFDVIMVDYACNFRWFRPFMSNTKFIDPGMSMPGQESHRR